jgi:hypothetical protein
MTVSAGSTVVATDYDTLRTRIAAEAYRRSIATPYTPDFNTSPTIGAGTFNSYISALSALNTLGTALSLPGYKVGGQSIVYAWEAALLFSVMTTLEGQQLACKFPRGTMLAASHEYRDYANMWTGMGNDGNTDKWISQISFSINASNVVTVHCMEQWSHQVDGFNFTPPSGCYLDPAGRYHATASGGALGTSLIPAWTSQATQTCDTLVLSINLYTSGGNEHLDIKWRYGSVYESCMCYAARWQFNMIYNCNGTITADSHPDVYWTGSSWSSIYDVFAVTGCTIPPPEYYSS